MVLTSIRNWPLISRFILWGVASEKEVQCNERFSKQYDKAPVIALRFSFFRIISASGLFFLFLIS